MRIFNNYNLELKADSDNTFIINDEYRNQCLMGVEAGGADGTRAHCFLQGALHS